MLSKIKAITNNRILSAFDHKIIRKSVFENPVSERIDQRKIIFFHPPKCGGTSVAAALHGRFGKNRIESLESTFALDAKGSRRASETLGIPLSEYRESLLAYAVESRGTRYVEGHFPFSDRVLQGKENSHDFVTVLRDPKEMLLSHYYYNKNKKNREHFPIDVSLEEWLETKQARSTGIIFLRMFIGDVARGESLQEYENKSESIASAVDCAISNLRKFTIAADIQSFSEAFKRVYSIDLNLRNENKNPATDYPRLHDQPKNIQDKIYEICEPDIKIYDAIIN